MVRLKPLLSVHQRGASRCLLTLALKPVKLSASQRTGTERLQTSHETICVKTAVEAHPAKPSARVHPDRIARGDRHYRDPRGPALAGPGQGQSEGRPNPVPEQPQAA